MLILGVDPGLHGALAWMDEVGALLRVEDMPVFEVMRGKTAKREVNVPGLASLLSDFAPDICFFEQTGGMEGDSAQSAYNFGRAAGAAEAAAKIAGARFEFVAPHVWKKAMGLIGTAKDQSRAKATNMWPGYAKTFALKTADGRAEAALLAEFGRLRLVRNGMIGGPFG